MASSTITLKFKNNKKRGNVAKSSSQTNAVQRLQVPPQKLYEYSRGRFPNKLCGGTFLGKIQFLNLLYWFSSCGRPISISTHRNTHTIVSSNNKHYQQRASQSYYLYFGVYRSQYIVPTTTLQEFTSNLDSQSFFLFFF